MPRNARIAAGGAGALLALLVALFAAIHVGIVERADASVLRGFADLGQHPRINSLAHHVAGLCDPNPYVYLATVPVTIALVRRRGRVVLAIIAILVGANATTELLKPLLDVHRQYTLSGGPTSGSWPSGHATASMALALCCVLAVPPRLRPTVAVAGAVFAVAVSYSFLSLEWHYPSDVLGGFLVASIWTLSAIAAVWTANSHRARVPGQVARFPRSPIHEALGPPTLTLLTALALAAAVAIARPHAVVVYARSHEAFVLGAAAIAAVALATATGIMLTVRR